MIKIINNHPSIHRTLQFDGVDYGINPNGGGIYLPDNLIEPAQLFVDQNPELQLINFAGPVLQRDQLDVVGKGQGINKTVSEIHGIMVTEDFGVNDELFLHWVFHPLIIRDRLPKLKFGLAPITSEANKNMSFEFSLLGGDGGTIINSAPSSIINLQDQPVEPIEFTSQDLEISIPTTEILEGYEAVTIKVRRIPSTTDELVGKVAMHYMYVEYDRYLV